MFSDSSSSCPKKKNFNGLLEKQADMENKGDYAGLISIQQAIKFNGGGHVSCSLFPSPRATPRPVRRLTLNPRTLR